MNNNLNILIVEDELLIAEMLKEMILELEYNVIAVAKNYTNAIEHLKKEPNINLVILDINLNEEKTGMDVAKTLNQDFKIPFIFLTSYSDKKTLKEAIVLKPEAYLIKPFTRFDLLATLELIKVKKIDSDKSIIIKDGTLTIKVMLSSILWLKSENVYVEIKTIDKTYLVRNSLDKFIEELNSDDFFRVHRSYAINLNQIKAINGQYVIIETEKIPLSRKYRDELMSKFSS